jgi:hypothetical protein
MKVEQKKKSKSGLTNLQGNLKNLVLQESKRLNKINYKVNLLSSIQDQIIDGRKLTLMGVLSRCDELSIFKTDLVKDLIDYKWATYAYRSHILSAIFHVMYVIVLIYYINHTYLQPYM